ncbi:hypothetical protein pipiens_016462 [Culex pipiens pipiens]|uniref:DNA/RNA non-specific endonuclease/pyrophosphatase/phosphodiesterase domain-containing protein n=1 Tax=Culex pipiens pipiens TaxID=38569 RepID=A0ABD1CM30_CULPP
MLGFKVLLAMTAFISLASGDCRIVLRSNSSHEKAPLFLSQDRSLYVLQKPKGSNFRWNNGETLVVGCANAKNKIASANSNLANVTCVNGEQFRLSGKKVTYGSLNCSSSVSASIKAQNRPCAAGTGKLFDIGFEVLGVPFVKYFQSCYNDAKSSVLYTEHELLGGSIDVAQIDNDRPAFKVGDLKSKVRFSSVYTQTSQRNRLATLLGSEEAAQRYISPGSFFAKGHLTPDGDAVLDTWADATYFYINAAPEWQVINVGNWLRVENAARKVAARLNDTVRVFTGVYDVLQLPDANGRPVPITLAENSQLEAPKWFWKIVHHSGSDSAIALVTLNNPFASEGEHLCPDVCDRFGWGHKEFRELPRGFTYCCSVQDLRKAIKFIPSKADAANILRFN